MAASLATETRTTTAATSATANHAWMRSTTGRGGDGGAGRPDEVYEDRFRSSSASATGPNGDAEPHLANDPYRDFPGVIWRVRAAGRSSTPVRHWSAFVK